MYMKIDLTCIFFVSYALIVSTVSPILFDNCPPVDEPDNGPGGVSDKNQIENMLLFPVTSRWSVIMSQLLPVLLESNRKIIYGHHGTERIHEQNIALSNLKAQMLAGPDVYIVWRNKIAL